MVVLVRYAVGTRRQVGPPVIITACLRPVECQRRALLSGPRFFGLARLLKGIEDGEQNWAAPLLVCSLDKLWRQWHHQNHSRQTYPLRESKSSRDGCWPV